jgi:hypothetical protein
LQTAARSRHEPSISKIVEIGQEEEQQALDPHDDGDHGCGISGLEIWEEYKEKLEQE